MSILRAMRAIQQEDELFLCGGALRNLVWDNRHGYDVATSKSDVDVIFFNSKNTDPRLEMEIEENLGKLIPNVEWDVKNQARMPDEDGHPVASLRDSLSYFPETASAVAIRLVGDTLEIVCPFGVDDLVSMRVVPTSEEKRAISRQHSDMKEWSRKWPKLEFKN